MTDAVASPTAAAAPTRRDSLGAAVTGALPDLRAVANHAGELTFEAAADRLLAVATTLRDHPDLKFDMCMDVCGVDYLEHGRTEWKTEDATSSGYSRGVARRMAPPLGPVGVPVSRVGAPGVAPPRAAAPRQWQSLSQPQQQLLQKYQGQWESLPAERQQALARGSQRWLSMSPEQRSNAQQRFGQWRAMPPEQRQLLRQRWQQFKGLPPEQQQRIRENFQRFRQMPPERRMELRRQWHQMSPEQRRSAVQRVAPRR